MFYFLKVSVILRIREDILVFGGFFFQIVSTGLQVNKSMIIVCLKYVLGRVLLMMFIKREVVVKRGYYFDDLKSCKFIKFYVLFLLLDVTVVSGKYV